MQLMKRMPRVIRAWHAARVKPLTFKRASLTFAGENATKLMTANALRLLDKHQFFQEGRAIPGKMTAVGRRELIRTLVPLAVPDKRMMTIIFNTQITDAQRATLFETHLVKKYGSKEGAMAEILAHDLTLPINPDYFYKAMLQEIKKRNYDNNSASTFVDNFAHSFFDANDVVSKLTDRAREKFTKDLGLLEYYDNEEIRERTIAELRKKARALKK